MAEEADASVDSAATPLRLESLSPAFRRFLEENQVDPDGYLHQLNNVAPSLPRFVRINPRNPISEAGLFRQLPGGRSAPPAELRHHVSAVCSETFPCPWHL